MAPEQATPPAMPVPFWFLLGRALPELRSSTFHIGIVPDDHLRKRQAVGCVQMTYLRACQGTRSGDCRQNCRCSTLKKTEGLPFAIR